MNIDKVKNYNQKMLAIITTAAVAFAIIGLFSFVFFLLTEAFSFFGRSTNYSSEGVTIEELVEDSPKDSKVKLHIYYNFPELVDTANQLYIIPIDQKTNAEIGNGLSKQRFSETSILDSYGDYNDNSDFGFVNLLLYDAKTGIVEKLFNQQIFIGPFIPKHFKDDILVVFEAADKDSNKDGKINLYDETSLYIYSMQNKTIKQAKIQGKNVVQHHFIPNTKNIVIRFEQFENTRTKAEINFVPAVLCKYNYETDQLIKINDNKLDNELKTILEGTK